MPVTTNEATSQSSEPNGSLYETQLYIGQSLTPANGHNDRSTEFSHKLHIYHLEKDKLDTYEQFPPLERLTEGSMIFTIDPRTIDAQALAEDPDRLDRTITDNVLDTVYRIKDKSDVVRGYMDPIAGITRQTGHKNVNVRFENSRSFTLSQLPKEIADELRSNDTLGKFSSIEFSVKPLYSEITESIKDDYRFGNTNPWGQLWSLPTTATSFLSADPSVPAESEMRTRWYDINSILSCSLNSPNTRVLPEHDKEKVKMELEGILKLDRTDIPSVYSLRVDTKHPSLTWDA
ncbi:uncharacterized protein L201_007794 [Kwoniella dendrophila CBS 6074]|uniref:Uncharacterized protein n=1 Tax=Kwoniella dendrophila CBS 6074 TaxID=1295534 RepID=A0AAX4K7M9_9TREE